MFCADCTTLCSACAVKGGAVPTPNSDAANRDVLHSACIKGFEGFGAQTEFPPTV